MAGTLGAGLIFIALGLQKQLVAEPPCHAVQAGERFGPRLFAKALGPQWSGGPPPCSVGRGGCGPALLGDMHRRDYDGVQANPAF